MIGNPLDGIKHISFDLWNTLISANPAYTEARTAYLSQYLPGKTTDEIQALYTKVKRQFDREAEHFGRSYTTLEVVKFLVLAITDDQIDDPEYTLLAHKIKGDLITMFNDLKPIVLPETIELLRDLQRQGFTLSIGSNTNFISGRTLHYNMINDWPVQFKFMLFSDLYLFSKPHPQFIYAVGVKSDVKFSEVIHIGDNEICDGRSNKVGIRSLIIKNPADLVNVLAK